MAGRLTARRLPRQRDREGQEVADAVETLHRQTSKHPLMAGDHVVIKNRALTVGVNVIQHGLGKVPSVWLVLRNTVAVTNIFETARDERTLTLSSSTAPTIDLLIVG